MVLEVVVGITATAALLAIGYSIGMVQEKLRKKNPKKKKARKKNPPTQPTLPATRKQ